MTPRPTLAEITNVSREYNTSAKPVRALRDVTLSVPRGEHQAPSRRAQ